MEEEQSINENQVINDSSNSTVNIDERIVKNTLTENTCNKRNIRKRAVTEDSEPMLVRISNAGGSPGRNIHIHNNTFNIGRGHENDEIILSVLISRNHCCLKRNENGDWMLTNLSSTCTLLNGIPIMRNSTHKLSIGDELQLSATKEFRYLFTLVTRCDPIRKKIRTEQDTVNNIGQCHQNKLAEIQVVEKNDLERQLLLEDIKQKKCRDQLKLLHNQQISEHQNEKLEEQVSALRKKIELNDIEREKLTEKYEQLIFKLEKEKQKIEQRLAEEKKKWEEALENTKREEESLAACLKLQMEEWKVKEEAEWKSKLETTIQEEKSVQQKLSYEKLQLEEKINRMEETMKVKEAKIQTMQAKLQNKKEIPAPLMESCIIDKIQNTSTSQVINTIDLTLDEPSYTVDKNVEAFSHVKNIMEEQLTCSICAELFIAAVTLNCTHTYCKCCIMSWMRKSKECPNCRTKIVSLNPSLVLDNFIEKMVDNFSARHKQRRKQLIAERLGPKTSARPRTRRRR